MRYLCFFFVLIIFGSCTTTPPEVEPDYTVLSGIIKGAESDSLYLYNHLNVLERIITLEKDHSFKDTIPELEGYYSLKQPSMRPIELFLTASFDLNILYDAEASQKVIFDGSGAIENHYLRSRFQVNKKLREALYEEKESEIFFLALCDSLEKVQLSDLNKIKASIDKDFEHFETQRIEFTKRTFLAQFKHSAEQRFGLELSDDFPDPFEGMTLLLENETFLQLSNFIHYVKLYNDMLRNRDYPGGLKLGDDFYITYIRTMDQYIKNPKIKDETIYYWKNLMIPFLTDVAQVERTISFMVPILSNPTYQQELEEELIKLRKILPGTAVEPFELYDQNDQLVSLQSLKGKLVYIDLWATWCGPCKKEIPHLEKLQTDFKGKDIYFVSISYEDNKEKWKKMVEEKEMGGIQLFAADVETPFFENLDIDGIPRFVLLDKEGKIVEAKARRPSYSKIIPYLEQYL